MKEKLPFIAMLKNSPTLLFEDIKCFKSCEDTVTSPELANLKSKACCNGMWEVNCFH